MTTSRRRSLLMGILCCPVGVGVGAHVAAIASGEGYQWFPLYAAVAAFITASLLWWLLIERTGRRGLGSGTAVGAASGLLAPSLCWYLMIIVANIGYWISPMEKPFASSPGEQLIDPLTGLAAALTHGLYSLLFYGWITIPAGGIIGGLFAWYLRRSGKVFATAN